ncbi:amino acid adenylation domain-containing protein [Streptomyces sp. NPDC012769]|uniref:non-ribosomal peptide synthetase n=1 Tax=Streptomyces sp. NPDC012769 TaxID=3364848 RepID=UPI0036A1CBBE
MTGPADLRALLAARAAAALKPEADVIPRRPDPSSPAPLTPGQRAMWLHSQYDTESAAYTVPFVLRFRGRLEPAAMIAAVRRLTDLHPVLRSTVEALADGTVHAVPRPAGDVPVAHRAIRAEHLDEEVQQVLGTPFDLAHETPTRACLLRVTDEDHVLVIAIHHIAADAYARATVIDDLARCYAAELGGPEPAPPELHYADLAAWRQARGDDPEEDLHWWASRLAGLLPVLELPTDRPREHAGWQAGEVPLVLDAETTARLRAFAAAAGCSPFMVLLTVVQVLLSKISGSTDIPVGVPEAGRHHPATQGMVGCFLNTLVVRTDVAGERTWRDLLRQVRDTCLDAFAHAETPFGDVVAHLRPERPAGTTPVFQVLLNVFDAARAQADFPGLRLEELDSRITTAKFDLAWHLVDHGDAGLKGALVYRAELFRDAFADRLAEWFRVLLDALLRDPDQPVAEAPLADVAEPAAAGPALARPAPDPVHRQIERWARLTPDAVAVTGADGSLTYAELDEAARAIAERIGALHSGAARPVGVMMERGRSLVAALLGVLRTGAPYIAVDPAYPPDRTARMLAAAGAEVLLTDGSRDAAQDYGVPHLVDVGRLPAPSEGTPHGEPSAEVRPEDPVYVLFTSGSTGEPKGVVVEHRHLAHYVAAFQQLMEGSLSEVPSFALVSTIAADLGLTNVFGALTGGGTLHLLDRETATDPAAYAAYLAAHRVDAIKMVPSHLEMLAAHGDLAALLPRRLLVLAGEPCPWKLVDRIHEVRPELIVHVHYGPTETTVSVLGGDVREVPAAARGAAVPLGRPLAGVRCHVVDPSGKPLPVGVPGELWVGGPTVARGYLGRDDLTAERFVADPLGDGRCYRTGDRVRVREDGLVEFLGRLDDQVKVRGFRVELAEVASALRDVPGVEEAVVLPVGDSHDRRLAAWITGPADAAAVRAALRGRLPDYMVPATVTPLAALPLNPNGKVDRKALPVPDPAADDSAHVPLATATEKHVAEVWQRVLGIERVGAEDDFFALGGNSFQAVLAIRETDRALRVIDLFTHPTVRGLATVLDRLDEQARTATEHPTGADRPPMLHRLGAEPADPDAPTLVCIPYGGGSGAAYQPLAEALAGRARLLAAELPGHDPADPEQHLLSVAKTAELLAEEITALGVAPVLYGHSAGAALATAVALRLERLGHRVRGLVVGARLPGPGPDAIAPSDVPDDAYLADLRTAGALPEGADAAFVRSVVRALRHDAQQARTWFDETGVPYEQRLRSPLLCVVGAHDEGTAGHGTRFREWERYARGVEHQVVPDGGHYFLKHRADALAALLTERLHEWGDPLAPGVPTRKESDRAS